MHKIGYCFRHYLHKIGVIVHFCRPAFSSDADTSLRLAKSFGLTDRCFLDIQNDIDLRELKKSMVKELNEIRPLQAEAV